ncbi:MAG: peptidoglycan endopeptidase [Bacteroidetes bacterium]|nr:peptidoglycan endopeptidase [Bacteroidota bacterium]
MLTLIFISCTDRHSEMKDERSEENKKTQGKQITDSLAALDTIRSLSKDSSINKELYAVSVYDTPVLNTPDFDRIYGGKDGSTLAFNKSGLVKELEYVAFPRSVFEIKDEFRKGDHSIYKVISEEYDIVLNGTELFIDSRFVELKDTKPERKKIPKPSKEQIYNFFDKCKDADYVWGANNINGVDKMFEFYRPKGNINSDIYNHWCMKGLDCSGLIYEATNGYTPRNTHQMVTYGNGIKIEGKSVSEIAELLEPLDMIVWKGHVIYVYDKNTTIQSAQSEGGVVKKDLNSTLNKIMQTRRPANVWSDDKGKVFVVRRWF